jgi:drug/metabolite transporter (DMT)-like permease
MTIKKGYLLIALAGCFWGTLGLFGKILFSYNFTPQLVVFCRLFMGFIFLCILILIKDKSLFQIDKRGLKYTALIGFFSQALFNILYFQTIQKTSITTAVILLYTAPSFLLIMGKLIYKEAITSDKIITLIMCTIGCFLAVTGGFIGGLKINVSGVFMGIGAGFTYALATILGKAILDKYHPLTIILYSFGFGWIFLVPISNPLTLLHLTYDVKLIISILGFGLIPATLSYVLYFTGLSHGVEVSKAGIISSLEIVVSVLISVLIFKEHLVGYKLVGVIIIMLSIAFTPLKNVFCRLQKRKFLMDKI